MDGLGWVAGRRDSLIRSHPESIALGSAAGDWPGAGACVTSRVRDGARYSRFQLHSHWLAVSFFAKKFLNSVSSANFRIGGAKNTGRAARKILLYYLIKHLFVQRFGVKHFSTVTSSRLEFPRLFV